MAEEKQEEQGLKCPICGKKLEDNFFEYHCDDCGFKVQHVISGTKIEDDELEKILAGETGPVHEFTSPKTGNTFKAMLKLSANKLEVKMVFDWDSGLKCPKCGKKIMESGKGFFCEGGDFKCWKEMSGTEISREELKKALEGQGDELGFRSHKTGKTFMARLVLNEAKDGLEFKFAERKSEDTGLKCPHCGKKILETDKGFFCEGKDFKCWKNTRGHEISREELKKILEGQGDELDFVGKSSGKPYKGRLVLNEAKDGLDFEFADKRTDFPGQSSLTLPGMAELERGRNEAEKIFAWDVEDYRSETGNLMIRRECLQAALADHFRERAARALKNPAVSLDNDRVWSWAGRAAADIDGYPDIADIDLEIDSIIENDFQMMIERREW